MHADDHGVQVPDIVVVLGELEHSCVVHLEIQKPEEVLVRLDLKAVVSGKIFHLAGHHAEIDGVEGGYRKSAGLYLFGGVHGLAPCKIQGSLVVHTEKLAGTD